MSIETEALKEFFAAINRDDMQAIDKDFYPQIMRIEPEGFPTAGTYRGITEVQAHVRKGRGTWAEGTCEPERFLVNVIRWSVFTPEPMVMLVHFGMENPLPPSSSEMTVAPPFSTCSYTSTRLSASTVRASSDPSAVRTMTLNFIY